MVETKMKNMTYFEDYVNLLVQNETGNRSLDFQGTPCSGS